MKNAAKKANITEEMINAYLDDFPLFASECLYVRDHDTKQIKPFELNPPQQIMHEIVEKQRKEKGFVRILLDKARRFGGSTYIEGRGYWRTSLWFNQSTFILAHQEDSTDTLFAMAKLFHERNPIAPQTKYSSKKELLFDTKDGRGLKSEYSLACARNESAGRSQGIHFLHTSELAYFPDNADELIDGLMSCFPADPTGTEAYEESTANGYGNRFQRDVFAAYAEGRYPYYTRDGITYAWSCPGNDWILVFIPWFAHPKYAKPFDTPQAREKFDKEIRKKVFRKDLMTWEDSDELKLVEKFSLSLEQLNWRKWAIVNDFKGRVDKFQQEFPSTVEESFLSKGSNVFPAVLCDMLEENCFDPIIRGEVVERAGAPKIRPSIHGAFSIWEKPDHDQVYFITVDSAGGKKKGQEDTQKEPDPSCIDVYNHNTGVQAAQWHGHIDYDMIGELVERIGRIYSHYTPDGRGGYSVELPIACVEAENHGHSVIADLSRMKYPQYEMRPGEPGWSANKRTKPQSVDDLSQGARDGGIQIRCRETISEMRTFVEKAGHFDAEIGCHDDRVTAARLGIQMLQRIPRYDRGKSSEVRIANTRQQKRGWDRSYQEVRLGA